MSGAPITSREEEPESDKLFGEVISAYTKEQAIEDGILADFGKFGKAGIVFTANLLSSFSKEEIVSVLLKGLALEFERHDLKIILVNNKKIYVDWNGADLTFMLPEDY